MSQNYNQGAARPQKKPVINRWEGEGIVKPRSGNDNDEIKFFPFKSGGGAIHITVACSEMTGTADQNGQPKIVTSYIPVNVLTNKLITPQQLMGIRSGMKVHVVGKLQPETYTSRQTNQRVTRMVVNAFVFEILEMPLQAQGGYQPQYQQNPYPPQQGGYAPYPPQGGYPAAPAYPQQGGGYPPYGQYPQAPQGAPAYGPQGGMPPQAPQASAAAPSQGANVPPYYQPPGYQQVPGYAQAPPPPQAAPAPEAPDDMGDIPV